MNAIAPADVNEILKHIAHRFPFLLVDRVAGGVAGESVQVVKLVSCNEPFFQGMAPDRMEMPQVLVLEALAQAAGVLTHYSGLMKPHGGSLIFFAAVEITCTLFIAWYAWRWRIPGARAKDAAPASRATASI